MKNAEEMGKYDAARLQHRNFDNRYFVGVTEDGRDCWYITCRSQKTGHILVVFSPEERVLDAIAVFTEAGPYRRVRTGLSCRRSPVQIAAGGQYAGPRLCVSSC